MVAGAGLFPIPSSGRDSEAWTNSYQSERWQITMNMRATRGPKRDSGGRRVPVDD